MNKDAAQCATALVAFRACKSSTQGKKVPESFFKQARPAIEYEGWPGIMKNSPKIAYSSELKSES
ncbi:hypothetical protein [[Acidovorax] ebreus]|uniref:hypothetical protein n=1 Tax=Diaphorobacter sp. LI3 TaxID=2952886 RepID=UPI00204C566E|nr:hypothetical protein MRB47_11140 [Diaphorobacter sp. LI3]